MAALEWAANHAELTGAGLEVLMTWEWPGSYGWSAPIPDGYDPAHDSERALGEILKPVRDRHPGITVQSKSSRAIPPPYW